MKYQPYSFSKLQTYEYCPRKFKIIYIDKKRIPAPSKHFEKGKFYHYVLEHFPNIPDKKFKFQFSTKEKKEEYKNNIKRFIALPETKEYLTQHSLFREKRTLMTPEWIPTKNRKESLLDGYIDYIGQTSPDELVIIDWKSQNHPSFPCCKEQLELYVLWLFMMTSKIKNIRSGFGYVENCEYDFYAYNREKDQESLKTILINKITKIEEDDNFTRNIQKDCTRCEYFQMCNPFAYLKGEKNG